MENGVLKSVESVVRQSGFVKINESAILEVCQNFHPQDIKYWMASSPFDFSDFTESEKLNFLFVLNSLNFCYWGKPKWTISYHGRDYDGVWAMIGSLLLARESGTPVLEANFLAEIKKEELEKILHGNVVIPLFEERLEILRENGRILQEKYQGKFENVIEAACFHALKLLNKIVSEFPSFYDAAYYKGQEVQFFKRAQLLVSDVYRSFSGKGWGKLTEIDKLTAFADYKIPQVLRKLDILQYSPDLASKVDNQIPLPFGSEEEVEIRANSVWAVELMKKQLQPKYPTVAAMDLDSYLWLLGQNKTPQDKPYHLTQTIFY
jgi:hypothetical protein